MDYGSQASVMWGLAGLQSLQQSFDQANRTAANTAADGSSDAEENALDIEGIEQARTALAFTPSPDVSARVGSRLAASIPSGTPEAQAVKSVLQSERALHELQLILGDDYSATNLADVVTFYLIAHWQIVNDADASGRDADIAAVHRQLLAGIARTPELLALPDAAKQELTETLGLGAMLAIGFDQGFQMSGQQANIVQFREGARKGVQAALGTDLKGLRLTANGFER